MLFECECGAIMCLEDMNIEGLTLALLHSEISRLSSLIDIKMNNIIADCINAVIKEGQIYKEKNTGICNVKVYH